MSIFCEKGYCPQCYSAKEQVLLQLNNDDFWECPNCHLQILGMAPVFSVTLPWRGNGMLKDNYYSPKGLHDTIIMGYIEKDGFYDADTANIIDTGDQLLAYINRKVFNEKSAYELHKFLNS